MQKSKSFKSFFVRLFLCLLVSPLPCRGGVLYLFRTFAVGEEHQQRIGEEHQRRIGEEHQRRIGEEHQRRLKYGHKKRSLQDTHRIFALRPKNENLNWSNKSAEQLLNLNLNQKMSEL